MSMLFDAFRTVTASKHDLKISFQSPSGPQRWLRKHLPPLASRKQLMLGSPKVSTVYRRPTKWSRRLS